MRAVTEPSSEIIPPPSTLERIGWGSRSVNLQGIYRAHLKWRFLFRPHRGRLIRRLSGRCQRAIVLAPVENRIVPRTILESSSRLRRSKPCSQRRPVGNRSARDRGEASSLPRVECPYSPRLPGSRQRMVPEPRFELGPAYAERILSRIRRGGESTFI